MGISRRELLGGAIAGAAVFALPAKGLAAKWGFSFGKDGPALVPVPSALPDRVFRTESAGISRATHEAHLKLWQGYANKTNEIRRLIYDSETQEGPPNQIYSDERAMKVNLAFAYGGYVNHDVYFHSLGEPGGKPRPKTLRLINEAFGSFERWKEEFLAIGMAGRGWAFLTQDLVSGDLENLIGDSQDTYPSWGKRLVLAMDVYEHAYYLDFKTDRRKYLDAFMDCVAWDAVDARLVPRG